MSDQAAPLEVLNLYAGLGGNRTHWTGCNVTAVELDPQIAAFYQSRFKDDTVIVGDAHEYLLENYQKFALVWSSVPCPSHSRARFWSSKGGQYLPVYPDFTLYQEIIFLGNFFEGKWVVENVTPYYPPLNKPTAKIGRHLFWANFEIAQIETHGDKFDKDDLEEMQRINQVDISGHKFDQRTDKILRNCVHPETGLHIFNESKRVGLFQLSDLK